MQTADLNKNLIIWQTRFFGTYQNRGGGGGGGGSKGLGDIALSGTALAPTTQFPPHAAPAVDIPQAVETYSKPVTELARNLEKILRQSGHAEATVECTVARIAELGKATPAEGVEGSEAFQILKADVAAQGARLNRIENSVDKTADDIADMKDMLGHVARGLRGDTRAPALPVPPGPPTGERGFDPHAGAAAVADDPFLAAMVTVENACALFTALGISLVRAEVTNLITRCPEGACLGTTSGWPCAGSKAWLNGKQKYSPLGRPLQQRRPWLTTQPWGLYYTAVQKSTSISQQKTCTQRHK